MGNNPQGTLSKEIPIVSIALLTAAGSSGRQCDGSCLICMPRPQHITCAAFTCSNFMTSKHSLHVFTKIQTLENVALYSIALSSICLYCVLKQPYDHLTCNRSWRECKKIDENKSYIYSDLVIINFKDPLHHTHSPFASSKVNQAFCYA